MCCLTLEVGFSCSSGPDGGLLLDPVAPFLEVTIEVPVWVGSFSSLSGLRTVDFFPIFPMVFSPGVVMTPRSWKPSSRSTPFSRFVTFWCFVPCELGSLIVPSLIAALLS